MKNANDYFEDTMASAIELMSTNDPITRKIASERINALRPVLVKFFHAGWFAAKEDTIQKCGIEKITKGSAE